MTSCSGCSSDVLFGPRGGGGGIRELQGSKPVVGDGGGAAGAATLRLERR